MTRRSVTPGRLAALLGVGWALLALVAMLWVFDGPDRQAHQSPDEAAMARATALVEQRGRPTEPVPFDDPAGLAHQRVWVRSDGAALAAYPPASSIGLGLAARLPGGAWLLFLLPAAGLGAAVSALALAMDRHQWLAGLAPALAFPATYWWLRPWHNTAQMLALAGFAALAAVLFVRTRRTWLGRATVVLATAAAAIRPDQVHLLLGLSLIGCLVAATTGAQRWRWVGVHAVAGLAWVAVNVGGNLATTGAALTSPIDLLDYPDEIRSAGQDLPFPLPQLTIILARRGVPDPVAVLEHVRRYLVAWGPIALATVPAAATLAVAGWRRRDRWRDPGPLAVAAATVLLGWYAISRVSSTDFGTSFAGAGMSHSWPRYVALPILALGVAAVVGVSRLQDRRAWWAGTAMLVAGAVAGAVFATAPRGDDETLGWLAGHLDDASAYAAALDAQAPADAFVYVWKADKHVWGVRPVGLVQVDQPRPDDPRVDVAALARSSAAALDAGYRPIVTELTGPEAEALDQLLGDLGLDLATTTIDLPPLAGTVDAPVWEVVDGR